VIYNHRSPVKPGIYQARIAVRDKLSGLLGGARQWIVVPDRPSGELVLSSLIIDPETVRSAVSATEEIQWSVDKKFKRGSRIRLLAFVYNSRPLGKRPDLTVRLDLLRNGQAVVTIPARKVIVDPQADPLRIPILVNMGFPDLSNGRYILRITVEDRADQKSAFQDTAISIQ
jgi:hypothetical protein